MRVPSTEVQNNFGKYLKFVEAGEEIIITKNGKDAATIKSIHDPNAEYVREGAPEYRSKGRVTYEEYLDLVENSEQRYELINGVLYNLASPSYMHQRAIGEIFAAMHNWFKGKSCMPLTSPFDITFNKEEDNICVVQPDIVVICDRENIDAKGKYQGVPTLVVEVLSPSTRSKDIRIKLDLYTQCGVREYWIVDPMNEQITVFALEDQDIKDNITFTKRGKEDARSFHFQGLTVSLEEIFA